jgi:hypothetical protein
MVQRRMMVVVVGLMALASACGSGGSDSQAAPTTIGTVAAAPVTTAPPAQVGSIGDAIQVAAGAPAMANDAACTLDRSMLESASEIYLTLNGSLPASQSALVDAGLIKQLSPRFDISPDGTIVPAAASPCT